MKIKLFIFTVLVTALIQGQQMSRADRIAKLENLPNSIRNQFKKTYGTARNYKEFKMIKKTDFIKFQRIVLDSVSKIKGNIKSKEIAINEQKTKITTLNTQITDLNKELYDYKSEEDNEDNIRNIFYSVIGILTLALLIFFFKYRSSNKITKIAKNNLTEVEEEFQEHRKKTLEREQKLRRQLQDEINKQRGV